MKKDYNDEGTVLEGLDDVEGEGEGVVGGITGAEVGVLQAGRS